MMIERISNFRMVRTVSEGEHAALLHAVSEKSGERVAVQVQKGAAATVELEQRWKRAVRVARLLAHPAVVQLVQAGRLPDGSVYLIKEQLAGETLAARLTSRPRLPMNELLRLGRQIATVLVAAHARGIVHRALRPDSLQLVPDPEAIGGERVKITDWGLAQVPPPPVQAPVLDARALALAARPTEPVKPPQSVKSPPPAEAPQSAKSPPSVKSPLSVKSPPSVKSPQSAESAPRKAAESGPVEPIADEYPSVAPPVPLDEPTYLAPEQCRTGAAAEQPATPGDPATLLERVDVYALGVVLFQMAAGQLPFSGRAPSEIIAMHLAALPPKIEQRGVIAPTGLSTLISTMLIKDPTARPTMREVEERLQQMASQQQLAQTITPATRVSSQALAQLQLSNTATVQMRVPADPAPRHLSVRGRWALAIGLGLVGVGGVLAYSRLGLPLSSSQTEESALVPVVPIVEPRPPSAPITSVPSSAVPDAMVPVGAVGKPAVVPPAPSVPPPPRAEVRTGIPPLRDLRVPSLKAPVPVPVRPLPAAKKIAPSKPLPNVEVVTAKKPAPSKPPPNAEKAAQAREQLLVAQAAFDRGDYTQAIAGANELLNQQPAAAVLLGQAACAVDDLTLVNRAYASLHDHPESVSALLAACKKHSIVLGLSNQLVRTRLR